MLEIGRGVAGHEVGAILQREIARQEGLPDDLSVIVVEP